MNKDKLFKHELSLLFLERSKIWLGYDGTDRLERMEVTRDIDIDIAQVCEAEQRRIDAAIRGKQ
jgi:hypothetical protein